MSPSVCDMHRPVFVQVPMQARAKKGTTLGAAKAGGT